jgi:hypothetical protein
MTDGIPSLRYHHYRALDVALSGRKWTISFGQQASYDRNNLSQGLEL